MTVEAPDKVAKKVANRLRSPPTGKLIDEMSTLRDRKRELAEQVTAVEKEMADIEEQLVAQMEREGISKATGTKASASISTTTVGSITDWDQLCAFVKKTGHFHLFQRRISDPAYRELLEAGKKVPGLDPFNKKRLNLRDL